MLSKIPNEILDQSQDKTDMQIIRAAIIAELDAVNLYEQLIANTKSDDITKVMESITGEEKTHIAELETILIKLDEEQLTQLTTGEEEVNNLLSE